MTRDATETLEPFRKYLQVLAKLHTAKARRYHKSPSVSAEVSPPSPRSCVGAWKSCETG